MSATTAIIGKGTTVGFGVIASSTYVTVAELIDFKPPVTSVAKAEATRYDSPQGYEEFVVGWKSVGDAELEINYTTAETTALEAIIGISKDWLCTLPDTHTIKFTGWISNDGIEVPNKKTLTQKIKVTVTGAVAYT
jgi:hypothetical protein